MLNIFTSLQRALTQPKMLTRSQLASFSPSSLNVKHDPKKAQFYIEMDGATAVIDYSQTGKNISFLHTEVPEIFQGKGVGKILAEEAFSFAVKNDLQVSIKCEYLQHYYSCNKDKYKNLKVE